MKIADKLCKVNDTYTISMYDNGYVFEISGKNASDDWKSVKIVVNSVKELLQLAEEACLLERYD
jgi:hypothetical protein